MSCAPLRLGEGQASVPAFLAGRVRSHPQSVHPAQKRSDFLECVLKPTPRQNMPRWSLCSAAYPLHECEAREARFCFVTCRIGVRGGTPTVRRRQKGLQWLS